MSGTHNKQIICISVARQRFLFISIARFSIKIWRRDAGFAGDKKFPHSLQRRNKRQAEIAKLLGGDS